jgi:hypothetical protein
MKELKQQNQDTRDQVEKEKECHGKLSKEQGALREKL